MSEVDPETQVWPRTVTKPWRDDWPNCPCYILDATTFEHIRDGISFGYLSPAHKDCPLHGEVGTEKGEQHGGTQGADVRNGEG